MGKWECSGLDFGSSDELSGETFGSNFCGVCFIVVNSSKLVIEDGLLML